MSGWQLSLIIVCAGCARPTRRIHAVDQTVVEGCVDEADWTDRTISQGLPHPLRPFTQHAARSSRYGETALLCHHHQLSL